MPVIDPLTPEATKVVSPTGDLAILPPPIPFPDPLPLPTSSPFVKVVFPNGGEILTAGQSINVTWQSDFTAVAHDVKYSPTGLAPFVDVALNLPGNQRSLSWVVPSSPTQSGVIRVVARDGFGNQNGDRSDGTFVIQAALPGPDVIPPTVQVTYPNGGEVFRPGDLVNIQWQSADNAGVASHDVRFSATGDAPFTDIALGLSGATKSFTWFVPNLITQQGVIRVVARDAAGNQMGDRSDAVFRIEAIPTTDTTPPVVTVLSPSGGELLRPGDTLGIVWQSSDANGVVAHDVRYSPTGQAPFTDIAVGLGGQAQSFSWVVPNQPTSSGAIRVVAYDAAGNQGSARSNGSFTIQSAPGFSFSPDRAPVGADIAIVGDALFQVTGVTIAGAPSPEIFLDPTGQLLVEVPAGITSGKVMLLGPSPRTSEGVFALRAAVNPPTITGIDKLGAAPGTTVLIDGTGFRDAAGNSLVRVVKIGGARVGSPTVISATRIQATVPSAAVTGKVIVKTTEGKATSSFDLVVAGPPSINTINPGTQNRGLSVTATGNQFLDTLQRPIVRAVRVGGIGAMFTQSGSSLSVTIPENAPQGANSVVVETPVGESPPKTVLVTIPQNPPRITTFTPAEGPPGTPVLVIGENLDAVTQVQVGNGTAVDVTVLFDRALVLRLPPLATTGRLTARSSAGMGQSVGNFTVLPAPTPAINDIVVGEEAVGAPIDIRGVGLAATTSVTIDGVVAPFIVNSDVSVTAFIPTSAPVRRLTTVSVTSGGRLAQKGDFALPMPPSPGVEVRAIDPIVGRSSMFARPGTTIRVFGSGLGGTSAVRFTGATGQVPAQTLTNISDFELRVVIPPGAKTGFFDVVSVKGTGQSRGQIVIDPDQDDAVACRFSPASGAPGSDVVLSGIGFLRQTLSVAFSGVASPVTTTITDNQLSARVPTATGSLPLNAYPRLQTVLPFSTLATLCRDYLVDNRGGATPITAKPSRAVKGRLSRVVLEGASLPEGAAAYQVLDAGGSPVFGVTVVQASRRPSRAELLADLPEPTSPFFFDLDLLGIPAASDPPSIEVLLFVEDSVALSRVRLSTQLASGARAEASLDIVLAVNARRTLPFSPGLVGETAPLALSDRTPDASITSFRALRQDRGFPGIVAGAAVLITQLLSGNPPNPGSGGAATVGVSRSKRALRRSTMPLQFVSLTVPPPSMLPPGTDNDPLAEGFEEALARAFVPSYHISDREADDTGFATFEPNLTFRRVKTRFPATRPVVHFRVKPLGFSSVTSRGVARRFAVVQVDYLTLWNRDNGVAGSPPEVNLLLQKIVPGGSSIEEGLLGHSQDEERSAALLVAELTASESGYPTVVTRYQAVEYYTAAHEGTAMDQSAYLIPRLPVSSGAHLELFLALSKHGTYEASPDFLPLLLRAGLSALDLLGNLVDPRSPSAAAVAFLVELAIFAVSVERFRPQGPARGVVPLSTDLIHVGEPEMPIGGATWINETEGKVGDVTTRDLKSKLTEPIWSVA